MFIYWVSALIVFIAIFVILRGFVRRDYQEKGRLTPFSSALEWLLIIIWVSFSYAFISPNWPDNHNIRIFEIIGWVCIAIGFGFFVYSLAWLGLRRAHGLETETLIRSGPYRLTRNPQIVGFVLCFIGFLTIWPSRHMVVSFVLLLIFSHTMVLTEEEHLQNIFGEAYRSYCQQTPRYIGVPGKI